MKLFNVILFILLVNTIAMAQNDVMLLKPNGRVVIGDTTKINTNGNYRLFVQEGILTERVKVALKNTSQWSDDAFEKTPEISEVEALINSEKHLKDMPSADELVKAEGYELMSMDAKLLRQIEWLWQHMIALSKKNEALEKALEACKN
ncbi:MAG: hypothetical protein IPL23_00320 [Saprospiraceae bacterium]|nr:hypothetical protein [Saprospiraceae bacterium]MBK8634411.1 hypothetical protein [Saprospiraceae bacterium]MBP7644940.1 hypothetical protein [Saprospiraceae bacterium]